MSKAIFENGASRSEHARMYHLIPREPIDAMADRMGLGFAVHGESNWMSGGPAFFKEAKNHLMTHWLGYMDTGDPEELYAVLTNAMMLTWWERKGRAAWGAQAPEVLTDSSGGYDPVLESILEKHAKGIAFDSADKEYLARRKEQDEKAGV